ncbi:hypothetical protein RB195_003332 [Necator americanus]|uniref:Ribosomal Proteins L2, RNA binding domain protein n=1 Tax=Necator americanus TaxID=51031 RepID=A0ABR1DN38_NECAM
MEDDGFKVVTYRKGKSWQKKSGVRLAQRIEGSLDDIRVALQKADSQIKSSGLSSWIIPEIKSIIGNRRIGQVYVVGNGHFDASWEPGAHQLALVLQLCREFQAMMVFQDPCLSQAEQNWLSKQKQVVSRDASDMVLECSEDNVDNVLLLVLIHGLHGVVVPFWIKFQNVRFVKMMKALLDLGFLRGATPGAQVVAKRFFPARGTKPLPRYLWDMEDLQKKTDGKYTHQPLRINRLGGRHPETGRKVNQHIGGGVKFDYFMVDYHRRGPTEAGETYDERVLEVRRDPNRTSYIALIAGTEGKRWILATENMKAGDIISTSCHIPENPVIGVEGNAYPLGALVPGTLVNSVERYPEICENLDSDVFVVKAGTAATIVRHQGDFTVIRLPHKHEFSLHRTCMATVGRLSHTDFDNKIYGSAQMHRRFGYKMASGLFHKKDGYFGRKIRPLPPVRVLDKPPRELSPNYQFSLTKDQLSGLFGHAKVHNLLPSGYSTRDYDYYKPK